MNYRYIFIVLSGAFLMFQSSVSKADDFAQFRIKVELSKMLVNRASVQCHVRGSSGDTGDGSTEFVLNHGAFRGAVTVHVNLKYPSRDSTGINQWRCNLMLFKDGQWKGLYNNNAASRPTWLYSKPGSQLVWEMSGDIRTPQASVSGRGASQRMPSR